MNLYPDKGNISGLDYWRDNTIVSAGVPNVAHNGTTNTVTALPCCQWLPEQLSLHPGELGQYSVVRWTAPNSGIYNLATTFSGIDFAGPTSTDVHVLYNGISLFNDFVNGFGSSSNKSFSTGLSVAVGDKIDFVAGFGGNNNFFNDNTGLSATLTTSSSPPTVPEPSSILGILSLGLLGISAALKRKA